MSAKQLALRTSGGTSSSPELRTEVVTVTPKLAASYLERLDPRQRPVNERVVASYAEQLKAGAWQAGSATMAFNASGYFQDGQHRCHAIVKSGVAMQAIVVHGVPDEAFANTDNPLVRTLAFRSQRSQKKVSVLSMVLRIAIDRSFHAFTPEQLDTAEDFLGETGKKFFEQASHSNRAHATPAPVKAAALISMLKYPKRQDEILMAYNLYATGDFKAAPRSMSLLNTRLLTYKGTDRYESFAYAMRAFRPTNFDDMRLQVRDALKDCKDIRDGVLADLRDAVA